MTVRHVVLVGGGARSGKSAFALVRSRELGARRLFVATARPYDAEMADRIARHRAERAGEYDTLEEPLALPEVLAGASGYDVAVVDCVTLWLSNQLIDGHDPTAIERRVGDLVEVLRNAPLDVVLVTNEVGMGVHPESALGRTFRDLAGRAHQQIARVASEIHLAALGVIVRLVPGPIEVRYPGDRK